MAKSGSLVDVAIRILTESPTPLRPGRIVGRAMTSGLLTPDTSSVTVMVQAILDHDVDYNGDLSAFVRTPSGYYGLNQNRGSATAGSSTDARLTMTMRLRAAAAAILGAALTPMPLEAIADRAVSEGLFYPSPRAISLVLEEEILREMLREGSQSKFIRTKTRHYGLRSRHGRYDRLGIDPAPIATSLPPFPFPRARYDSEIASAPTAHVFEPDLALKPGDPPILAKPPIEQPGDGNKPRPSGDYVGKAGEHLVASKLLFLRHDVSFPVVDIGADLITTNSSGHDFVQVKTAVSKENSYRIGIRVNAFKKNAGKNMFYVFVLRQHLISGTTVHFLVFPHRTLENYIAQEHIQQGSKNISMKFIEKNGRLLLGPQKLDVSYYRDNWIPFSAINARDDP